MVRVNIRIQEDVKEYFEKQSIKTGVSQSSLMALALYNYVQEQTKEDKK